MDVKIKLLYNHYQSNSDTKNVKENLKKFIACISCLATRQLLNQQRTTQSPATPHVNASIELKKKQNSKKI
jgi:hypothetical protein